MNNFKEDLSIAGHYVVSNCNSWPTFWRSLLNLQGHLRMLLLLPCWWR